MIYLILPTNTPNYWEKIFSAVQGANDNGYEIKWLTDFDGISFPTFIFPNEEAAALFKLEHL